MQCVILFIMNELSFYGPCTFTVHAMFYMYNEIYITVKTKMYMCCCRYALKNSDRVYAATIHSHLMCVHEGHITVFHTD